MNDVIQLGLVGFGKIARDQHLPAIAATSGIDLVATASRNANAPDLPAFTTIEDMLAGMPQLNAVALCQPPQARFAAARTALQAGKHVFMEKPPGATVSEVAALVDLAEMQGVTLYASWHSRHASGVAITRDWAAARPIDHVRIIWKEDVRVWHPGQRWIWEPGGFGVFDPGINALSILTAVMPERVRLIDAALAVPSNCHAPIAASLAMATASGIPIDAEFDFRQTGPQTWDIEIVSGASTLRLGHGGNNLMIDGATLTLGLEREYPSMYAEFVGLVRARENNVDLAPLQLVADAFLRGRIAATEPFYD